MCDLVEEGVLMQAMNEYDIIAFWLDITGTDLNGGRWGSVSPPSPRRLHHHTRGNADSAVKIMPLSPSSDNMVLSTCSPTALTSLRPSTALPSVSCFSSTSTVQKGFVSPSHKGTPVSKKNTQKGVITQLLLALLSFPVMRPAYVRTDTQDLTHGERTTWATWSYILPDSSAAPPGLHPSLHKTGRVDKRSLSASHVHKKHTFVTEVAESSETWEWGQLMGSRLRKGLTNQKQFLPQ